MDQDFMNRFMPRVVDVLFRDKQHWNNHQYEVVIPSTQMCNMGYVVSGEGKLEINDESYMLRKGCFYHVSPPGVRLRFTTESTNPLLYIAVHFDYRLIEWEGRELTSKGYRTSLRLPHVLELDSVTRAEEQFRQLLHLWNDKGPGYEWRSRNFLIHLLDQLEGMQASKPLSELRAEQSIHHAMEHVHEHFREPLNREQMAQYCSLSVSYFSLLFKKYTGYSYVQYLHKVRLEKAKMLLRNGFAPVSEIARDIGYEDPLYFSKLFTREVGLSPRDYRKG
ncbi:AraC family transcriptional regulator [Paenibacillus lautus]|uniref:AraC family transcriptional regulator n=1 Tax=Paenibacillus lautus TaxID=1401 RepID=UPI001C10A73F|nr:AraC family transcriptional regulator [Paenibacillus lautus]MBU5348318.1 AraC family transcriptional regulator [Paenibacillus lautus]